jgi:hypothetical protein
LKNFHLKCRSSFMYKCFVMDCQTEQKQMGGWRTNKVVSG